jgi:catechol 2,3-dioxygenase-like lactoylglutathione lyase family enzyme
MVALKESQPMQPRITVVTIGVDDLERALRFYRDGLGLATEGIIGKEFAYGAVVFIELQAGVLMCQHFSGQRSSLVLSACS